LIKIRQIDTRGLNLVVERLPS